MNVAKNRTLPKFNAWRVGVSASARRQLCFVSEFLSKEIDWNGLDEVDIVEHSGPNVFLFILDSRHDVVFSRFGLGELDMRTGTREQVMKKFVVPSKLLSSAANVLSAHRPIKLFMQFDNDAELN